MKLCCCPRRRVSLIASTWSLRDAHLNPTERPLQQRCLHGTNQGLRVLHIRSHAKPLLGMGFRRVCIAFRHHVGRNLFMLRLWPRCKWQRGYCAPRRAGTANGRCCQPARSAHFCKAAAHVAQRGGAAASARTNGGGGAPCGRPSARPRVDWLRFSGACAHPHRRFLRPITGSSCAGARRSWRARLRRRTG